MKRIRRRSASQNMTGQMISTGVGNLVGMGLLGATAGMANSIPAGVAHDMAGLTVGLQATSMIGPNLRMVNNSLGSRPRMRRRMYKKRY